MSWSRASRDISPAETKTILSWLDRRWRKNSHRNLLSGLGPAASPSSCCIRRKICNDFLSPSSSAVKSCWRQWCSEAAVHWISCALKTLYGLVSGGARRRSLTLVVNYGTRAPHNQNRSTGWWCDTVRIGPPPVQTTPVGLLARRAGA